MIRVLILLPMLVAAHCVGSGTAAEPASVHVERVETGLRPAILLEGSAQQRFRLEERMRFYKTPGVSVAVIDNHSVAWARGYGVREAGTTSPVTADTLFQAASISKPVAALVALRLVEQGKLDLDEDINHRLTSWKLPENELTAAKNVSLRLLLSHRGGLTDDAGFKGVAANEPRPSLREILETGRWTPAPIRVGIEPGLRFQYSGGGYCLLEQLLEDVSGKPFPALARELVLEPLAMTNSSFEQPLSSDRAGRAAVGHTTNGKPLPHGWNDYAASSAAGLWTTPTDLAKFAIELQRSSTGRSSGILSRAMSAEMLTIQGTADDRESKAIAFREALPERPPPSWGLGIGLIGRPPSRFFHTGVNPGYQSELQACLEEGRGAVIMTCGDQGWRLAREILWAIAEEYQWPDYEYRPEVKRVARLSPDELDRFAGRYRLADSRPTSRILEITREGDGLFARLSDHPGRVPLYPESADRCFTIENATTLWFLKEETGRFTEAASDQGWRARREPDQ